MDNIIHFNETLLQDQLKVLVRGSIEEISRLDRFSNHCASHWV